MSLRLVSSSTFSLIVVVVGGVVIVVSVSSSESVSLFLPSKSKTWCVCALSSSGFSSLQKVNAAKEFSRETSVVLLPVEISSTNKGTKHFLRTSDLRFGDDSTFSNFVNQSQSEILLRTQSRYSTVCTVLPDLVIPRARRYDEINAYYTPCSTP